MAIQLFKTEDPLREAVELAGGSIQVAKACHVSRQAVDKWLEKRRLPRTEYSGESGHAAAIAALAHAKGGEFSANDLLEALREKAAA